MKLRGLLFITGLLLTAAVHAQSPSLKDMANGFIWEKESSKKFRCVAVSQDFSYNGKNITKNFEVTRPGDYFTAVFRKYEDKDSPLHEVILLNGSEVKMSKPLTSHEGLGVYFEGNEYHFEKTGTYAIETLLDSKYMREVITLVFYMIPETDSVPDEISPMLLPEMITSNEQLAEDAVNDFIGKFEQSQGWTVIAYHADGVSNGSVTLNHSITADKEYKLVVANVKAVSGNVSSEDQQDIVIPAASNEGTWKFGGSEISIQTWDFKTKNNAEQATLTMSFGNTEPATGRPYVFLCAQNTLESALTKTDGRFLNNIAAKRTEEFLNKSENESGRISE
ncbi:MAG: hypothetical protein KDD36_00705 [Flavobacteriales bacterium]|nr:hypothetical protein [Flavobacteriales bacterium]